MPKITLQNGRLLVEECCGLCGRPALDCEPCSLTGERVCLSCRVEIETQCSPEQYEPDESALDWYPVRALD